MEPELLRPFLEYGVLGMGWIGVVWLIRIHLKREERIVDIVSANTSAMTRLAERLKDEVDS